jgi:hypothetical protein
MKRRGKGALMKAWCAFLMREARKKKSGCGLVVFDAHDEYSRHGRERPDCQLGPLPQRMTVDEFLDEVKHDETVVTRADLALALVMEDEDMNPEKVAKQVTEALPVLRDRGNCIVVFDELGYWGRYAQTALHAVAACWGKEGIIPFYVSQAVMDTPEDVRKQWSSLVTAQQVKKSDLIFLKAQAGRNVARAAATLPRLHYVRADLTQLPEDVLESLAQ